MGQAKIRQLHAQAAATNGRVPISVDTVLRLSRLWFEYQGALKAANQAAAISQAASQAYIEGLSGVLEALDLGVEAVVTLPTGEQRLQVNVDFKARELVLPPVEKEDAAPAV